MAALVVVPATLSGEPMPQLRLARQTQELAGTVPTGILGHRVRSELVARNFGASTGATRKSFLFPGRHGNVLSGAVAFA